MLQKIFNIQTNPFILAVYLWIITIVIGLFNIVFNIYLKFGLPGVSEFSICFPGILIGFIFGVTNGSIMNHKKRLITSILYSIPVFFFIQLYSYLYYQELKVSELLNFKALLFVSIVIVVIFLTLFCSEIMGKYVNSKRNIR